MEEGTEDRTAEKRTTRWWQRESKEAECAPAPRRGQGCPQCGQGCLDFDSLFVLTCEQCGYVASSGAFT
ncbi:MAG TPA: hypothetical protein VK879_07140 [Candidatus Sulfomarinibacteraceae bacterium]|nr:hypothetical protein [Candidatus Sulfomarinibacteraceae bacterium]